MNEQSFLATIYSQYPELTKPIKADQGLFYLQVATFKRHVQAQIDSGSKEKLEPCLQLIEAGLRQGNDEVMNALGVSCLEHLNFTDGKRQRSWALQHLLPLSVAALKALGRYPSTKRA